MNSVNRAEHRSQGSWAVYAQARIMVGRPDPRGLRPPLTSMSVTWLSGDLTRVRRTPVVSGRSLQEFATDPVYPGVLIGNEAAASVLGTGGDLVWGRAGGSVLHRAALAGVVADGATEPLLYGSLMSAFAVDPLAVEPP